MQRKAMTLLEVLIALFVFAIGILAVVRVITTNISIIDTMKVRTEAQSLAKEGIDLIFNLRDTNLERGVDRQCAFLKPDAISALENGMLYNGEVCGGSFTEGARFRIAMSKAHKIFIAATTTGSNFIETWSGNRLLQYTGGLYNGGVLMHDAGVPSFFARYIHFEPVYQSGVKLDSTKLLKVVSHVLYQKGSIKGEVTLESFIGAIRK